MRICHVNEPGAGGSFAVLLTLAAHGVGRGHDVHVIYSAGRADADLVARLRASGAAVHICPMQRPVGVADLRDGLRLRRLLRSLGDLDIVHSHSSKAGALARTFGPHRRTAHVYSPHGFYTMTGEAPTYIGQVERALSRVTDRIVAVSRFEKEHAIFLGIPPEKVTIIPNGLAPYAPLERSDARRKLGLDPDQFVVGFVGRLEPQKDPLAAVATMQALGESGIVLAIIGEGGLSDESRRAASGTNADIRFLGALSAQPFFGAFDVLLCTSRYEGMPVAFLESLNAGVPIVSYPVGGTDELIDHAQTGYVVESSPSAAATAIRTISGMLPQARRKMSDACRLKAACHSDEVMGEATLKLYAELLARR